jgi:hypothetical protein
MRQGTAVKCMPQMLADPRFKHEENMEIDATPRAWRRAPVAAPVLPARQLHRYCHLYLLSSFTRRAISSRPPTPIFIRSYNEDLTLSRRTVGMPEFNELIDMARLLVNLWEAAQRLPEGSERREAFRQISGFQRRVAALVTRAL